MAQKFVSALYSVQLWRQLVIGQFNSVQLISAFHWSPSTGKLCMTRVPLSRLLGYYPGCTSVPEQTETGGPNYRIGPDCAGRA